MVKAFMVLGRMNSYSPRTRRSGKTSLFFLRVCGSSHSELNMPSVQVMANIAEDYLIFC